VRSSCRSLALEEGLDSGCKLIRGGFCKSRAKLLGNGLGGVGTRSGDRPVGKSES